MCRCIAYWGKQTRVGLVVYIDGLPSKEDYRVYSMPDSSDDYATLHAWVQRNAGWQRHPGPIYC